MSRAEVTIEDGGLVLRGVAVPWNEDTVVVTGTGSRRVVHRERFDAESIPAAGALYGVPLMFGHDHNRPAGRIRLSRSTDRGLEIEADLIGADDELEGVRRRLAAGLMAGLSIGFVADSHADVWIAPEKRSELPVVIRRHATIREVSFVQWPAYASAGVDSVNLRTSVGEWRHVESTIAILSAKRAIADSETYLSRRRT